MYRRKKIVFLFFIFILFFTHTPSVYGVDAWWNASWQKRIKITFANASRAENLTNFPILVSLSSSRIDFSDVNSNGSDLRFVDADGTTVLDYEIEKWNPSGTSSVWVRVPQIDASSDTDYIYLYYKNTGASSGANPSGVWDSSYLSVLHMGDNPTSSGPQQDSTANNSDATSIALSATTTGAIGDALDLNGTTQYVQYASTTLPTPINAGTVEIIYNPDTFAADVNGRYLFTKDKSGTYMGEWRLMLGSESAVPAQSNKLAFRIECPTSLGGNGNAWAVVSDIAPQLAGGWYSATAVWNKAGGAGNMKLYWNGTATGTPYLNTTAVATADPTCAMEVSGEKPEIGRNNGKATPDGYFDGQMDEFRISNVVRSANWINATYASSFDTLNTYGSAEVPDTTPPVISSVASTTAVTTASVTWTTDESSDSAVWYGTVSGSYTTSTTSASLVTSHSMGLTGLSAETEYYYVVVSKDASNNTSTSSEYTLLTTAAPDTTAPVISSVATSTTSTTATITWSTNENATSTVNYGTTSGYGSASTSASLTTSHSITLTGLSPLTTYHFQVSSGDSSYNYATTSDYTLMTGADTTGPTISNISVSETSSGGTISWTTNELASSLVAYGPGTSFGATTTEADTSPRVLSHSVVFADLLACSRYFFRIASEDAAGNRSYSSENTFSTTGCTGSASIEDVEVENLDVSTGGTLSVGGSGQHITLDIPADATATSSSLTFQLKIISDSSVIDSISSPADKSVAEGHIYDLKAFINATTTLSTFDEPLTITLSYDDNDVRGVSESSLLIYRYDGGSWIPLSNCSVNTSANTITCETDHFSVFGLFGTTQSSSSGGGSSNKPKNINNIVTTSTPALNIPVFTKLLVLGTVDAEVLTLQKFLNQDLLTRVAITGVGSPGFETSKFGELTKEAVIKFQIKNGIIASRESVSAGVVGPQTRLKLNSLITNTSISPVVITPNTPITPAPSNLILTESLSFGTISPQVKILQHFLNQDLSTQIAQSGPGSNGQETENFGSLTKEAVIKFQIKYGIIKDRTDKFAGTVGLNTREKINSLLKK